MQPIRVARSALLLALTFGAVACVDFSSPQPELIIDPVEHPFIRGDVTAIDTSRGVLVEGEGNTGAEKSAYVRLTPTTSVWWKLASTASTTDIVVGRSVTVWIDGPVLDSLPQQVTARVVVIDGAPQE